MAFDADGIATPSGKRSWSPTTVKSILTNEKYKGDALPHKSDIEDFLTNLQVRNTGEVAQYYVEASHEPVASAEIFDTTQRELARRKARRSGRHSGISLLPGRVECGCRGALFGSKVWHSIDKHRRAVKQYNRKYANGRKYPAAHLTADEAKAAFVSAADKLFATRQAIRADCEAVRDELCSTTELEARRDALASELQTATRLIGEAIADNTRTFQDQDAYQHRYDELVERYDSAKERLGLVEAEIAHKTGVRETIDVLPGEIAGARPRSTHSTRRHSVRSQTTLPSTPRTTSAPP